MSYSKGFNNRLLIPCTSDVRETVTGRPLPDQLPTIPMSKIYTLRIVSIHWPAILSVDYNIFAFLFNYISSVVMCVQTTFSFSDLIALSSSSRLYQRTRSFSYPQLNAPPDCSTIGCPFYFLHSFNLFLVFPRSSERFRLSRTG